MTASGILWRAVESFGNCAIVPFGKSSVKIFASVLKKSGKIRPVVLREFGLELPWN